MSTEIARPLTTLFADNFWGEANAFAGFEALSAQMRKGRKETAEIVTYVKERIAIEEEYAKKLTKLGKTPFDNEGFNTPKHSEEEFDTTLKAAFVQVKEGTDSLASKHKILADDLSRLLHKPLENFKDNQKKTVTEVSTAVVAAQKEFQAQRTNLPKLKKAYEAKCKELEAVKEEIDAAGGPTSKDKKIEKLIQKRDKLQAEVKQYDGAYNQGVVKLEASRVQWEEEMTNACHVFEAAELERIKTLKDRLTELVSLVDRLHSSYKTIADQQKTYLECIKPEIDIEVFVEKRRTGYTHPGPVLYENYYTGLMKDAIFGVPLAQHLEATGTTVPVLVERCIRVIEEKGLKDEGIYRLSGRVTKVRQLRTQFDKDPKANINLEGDPDIQVNDLASLLKLYFRELPQPLMTFELYDNLMAAVRTGTDDERKAKLKPLVQQLPAPNKATLQMLLTHLRKVASFEETNKMTVANLAIVFGPCLVRSNDEANALKDFRVQSRLVEDLINFYSDCFE